MRVGLGYDVHAFAPGRELWLGGIRIPSEKGLLGHSDADVAIHALCDALLGAASMRDIGYHFPDTKGNEFEGIDSKILLARVTRMLRQSQYEIVNCDITIAAQSPKLSPHIEAMQRCLAGVMEISTDRVSIKATTTEHLGFVGREEGISAEAVVLLRKSHCPQWIKRMFGLASLVLALVLPCMGQPQNTQDISVTRDTLWYGQDSVLIIETACAPICSSIARVYNKEYRLLRTIKAPIPDAIFPEAYIENGVVLWRDNTELLLDEEEKKAPIKK